MLDRKEPRGCRQIVIITVTVDTGFSFVVCGHLCVFVAYGVWPVMIILPNDCLSVADLVQAKALRGGSLFGRFR